MPSLPNDHCDPAPVTADGAPLVFTGTQATFQEQFLIEWGRETWKKSLEQLSAGLQRLVTLNAALLAGSVALQKGILDPTCRWLAAVLFLLSLGIALNGSTPKTRGLDTENPEAVEAYKNSEQSFRASALQHSSIGLFTGLAVALVGALIQAAR